MKVNCLYFLLSYVFLGNAWADETAFQLTGIIKVNDTRTALIEYRSGENDYFHEGDAFGNGKILKISDDWIKVAFPNGKTDTFQLNGWSSWGNTDYFSAEGEQETQINEIGAEYARSELEKAKKKEDINKKGELVQEINRILGIPVEAKIETVNGQPFSSVQVLVDLLRSSLDNGGGTLITVSDMPNGTDTIYLMTHAENVE